MERAGASAYASELTDAGAPTVAAICARLDGIALAVELAGSRVGAYGIQTSYGPRNRQRTRTAGPVTWTVPRVARPSGPVRAGDTKPNIRVTQHDLDDVAFRGRFGCILLRPPVSGMPSRRN
jgi:hypothetical protein